MKIIYQNITITLTIPLYMEVLMVEKVKEILNRELNQLAYNLQLVKSIGRPVIYQIELTNHCPMTCGMCPRTNRMTRELGYMDESLFKKIIQETSDFSSRIFLHHFGDSLLHPELGECIRYAYTHNIKTFLSANPILLTEKRSRELVDNGLYELIFSLDGLTSDTSAAIRGQAAKNVVLAEEKILSFLEYRRTVGSKTPFVQMQIVRQKQNIHEIESWVKKWKDVDGVDRVKVKSYITWDGRDDHINSMQLEKSGCSDTPNVVCDKPWTSITVLWDGRVVPCCFDYDGIYILGDLCHQSLKEIWNGNRMRYLRKCHREGSLQKVSLCDRCTDIEGYPVRKWYYPLNRWFKQINRLGDEWSVPE
jgi:MoaA/NifB/PqqE/SkfB family radical SAM enzyme